ncbi:MAG: amidohydrolase [Candidatus Adiutricales bacterium]
MADLLLTNGNVMTMDPSRLRAGSVAIRSNRILAAGEADELAIFKTSHTQVIDLAGKTVLPGFIDAHLHFRALAEKLVTLDLSPNAGIRSISDIKEKIQAHSQNFPKGEWIRAGGYNEIYLAEERDPTRFDLDQACSTHPVKLTHRSGHAHVLNSLGLKLVGITNETPEPVGGIIERDLETGLPTGLLHQMGDFLASRVPPLNKKELEEGVRRASLELISNGITSFHDASSRNNLDRLRQFDKWITGNELFCRVNMMLGLEGFEEYQKNGLPFLKAGNRLKIGGVKIVLDETTGRLNPSREELNEIVWSIHSARKQAVIHAIEAPAIEAACAAIENALKKLPRPDHRHRVEHCSVCPRGLAERLASIGVIVATNPAFIYFSGDRYLRTVEKAQLPDLYPISTLQKAKVRVAAGSDAPISGISPLTGIYAAAARMADNGKLVNPGEKIAVPEAIRMYTYYAALSAFEETHTGSITLGKLADLVVLSHDPTSIPVEEIKDIHVEMTIWDGKIVWSR